MARDLRRPWQHTLLRLAVVLAAGMLVGLLIRTEFTPVVTTATPPPLQEDSTAPSMITAAKPAIRIQSSRIISSRSSRRSSQRKRAIDNGEKPHVASVDPHLAQDLEENQQGLVHMEDKRGNAHEISRNAEITAWLATRPMRV